VRASLLVGLLIISTLESGKPEGRKEGTKEGSGVTSDAVSALLCFASCPSAALCLP